MGWSTYPDVESRKGKSELHPQSQTNLFSCIASAHRRAQHDVAESQQPAGEAQHPEIALLPVAMPPGARRRFGGSHGQPGHGGDVSGGRAVGDLQVGRVAVVDGAGEGVQLLQGDAHLHAHVVGDEVPASHADVNKQQQKRSQTQTIFI